MLVITRSTESVARPGLLVQGGGSMDAWGSMFGYGSGNDSILEKFCGYQHLVGLVASKL